MNDLQQIKNRLLENENLYTLLENIGCEQIKYEQGGRLITSQLPTEFDSDNKRSVQVKVNNNIYCNIRSRDFSGDIFNLVSYIYFNIRENYNSNLTQSKEYICKLFSWEDLLDGTFTQEEYIDYTKPLKDLFKYGIDSYYEPNEVLSENIINEFYLKPYYDWYKEGISLSTQREFQVGIDLDSHRIIFPYRNQFGQLVGVKGRAFEFDVNEYNPKYKYIYPCNASMELFNYHRAKDHIEKGKKVIIFEGEKSVMKLHSHDIYNSVALGSSSISSHQASLFSNRPDIEIILAYDKDKTIEEILEHAKAFDLSHVTFLYDKHNLLQGKDSPIDKGIDIFNKLYDKRYSAEKVNKFIESIESI